MTEPHDERANAVECLYDALDAATVDEKNFYIREAMQLLTLASDAGNAAEEGTTD